jgi:uncharacterized protein (TIGR00290 family)
LEVTRSRAIVSWSTGKDSALALYDVLKTKKFEILSLLTTVSDAFHRVSMHGVREELLNLQSESLGLQVEKVLIPYPCPNDVYERKMRDALLKFKSKGLTNVVFGDLFLEDIRKYREEKLTGVGITPIFPLWKQDTSRLAKRMLEVGFRAVITCVDPKKLDTKFAGRQFDESFLEELPFGVDPCGENGEFHTFVYDGPIFEKPIDITMGDRVMRDGFQFVDVLPVR